MRAVAYDDLRGHVLLFGGLNSGLSSDLWSWDGVAWRLISTGGIKRYGAKMAFDNNRGVAVVYGGTGTGGLVSSTAEWDGSKWRNLAPMPGRKGRFDHTIAYDSKRGRVMVFGGHIVSSWWYSDELWAWNGVSWSLVASGTIPSRSEHVMCYDDARDRLVVFGGGGPGGAYNDTWEWDGVQWRLRATGSGSPAARSDESMVYDKARGRAVLVGGVGPAPLANGTWEWDGIKWRLLSLPQSLQGVLDSWLVYDSIRKRVVLVAEGKGQVGSQDTWEYFTALPAAYAETGTGCAGSAGLPRITPMPASALPWLGDSFELELSPVPANAPVAWNIGFSSTQWGALTLPAPLASIGMPGCAILSSGEVSLAGTAVGSRATLTLQLPVSSAHAGLVFYSQAFVIDPSANALGVISSHAGVGMTGIR